jgi:ribosome maturation factor RimP
LVIKENRSGLELKFFELTQKILKELNLELYDLEWVQGPGDLRIFIMNPETKTAVLEDCIKVDRAFSPYIETEAWMPENITLEVSSPGLFRHLNQVVHFQMSIGEELSLTLNKKIDEEQVKDFPNALRNNLKLKVKLNTVDSDGVNVEVKNIQFKIPFTQIKKANLETDINYKG